MRDGGYPVDARSALIRNLVRAVDFLPGLYVLGMTVVFMGRAGKRVGDYAAGTMVIKQTDQKPEAGADTPAAIETHGLLPHERAWVDDYQVRAQNLDPVSAIRVATAIATKIAVRLGEPPPVDPRAYLERFDPHEHP